METSLYEISFRDGRMFRVFCANKKQKQRIHQLDEIIKSKGGRLGLMQNGIHDIKQFEQIINNL